MEIYVLGIIIAICGNLLISISLNIQKYTHTRQSQQGTKPYYTSRLWWYGILLMGLGELGNFAAYGFAPASLIAPLGCVSVIASAIISVVFLKEILRASDVLGGVIALTGTYLLVTFAPHSAPHVTANMVERCLISWQFLTYFFFEVVLFCILLYLYKCRNLKHIVIVMLLVALLASVTVITVKAVSGMITETIRGSHLQLTYPIFYIMFIIMVVSCAYQIKFLNEAMKMFDATEIVPINFVFFTTSAVIAGHDLKSKWTESSSLWVKSQGRAALLTCNQRQRTINVEVWLPNLYATVERSRTTLRSPPTGLLSIVKCVCSICVRQRTLVW
ncbi:NIPA-like protein 2 isoform X2 [Neoarius graeffei]|uniref:NIPA-like protein 2 isoform X2 n=1 Tax=Neoarius graeffei TaxID=443677 RepID=UPI00298CE633|nr:NIPA-like protein 2 isoform X2 [Neoarius graeffei]